MVTDYVYKESNVPQLQCGTRREELKERDRKANNMPQLQHAAKSDVLCPGKRKVPGILPDIVMISGDQVDSCLRDGGEKIVHLFQLSPERLTVEKISGDK